MENHGNQPGVSPSAGGTATAARGAEPRFMEDPWKIHVANGHPNIMDFLGHPNMSELPNSKYPQRIFHIAFVGLAEASCLLTWQATKRRRRHLDTLGYAFGAFQWQLILFVSCAIVLG